VVQIASREIESCDSRRLSHPPTHRMA
jgi:hypothetical protein